MPQSPRLARRWTSSRWRPLPTCVYLHHLKDRKGNVIKIYLNRRIRPIKQRCTEDLAVQRCLVGRYASALPVQGATPRPIPLTTAHRVSIHAPLCEERQAEAEAAIKAYLFQSTLPVRGATAHDSVAPRTQQFQSTLPVRGATVPLAVGTGVSAISIHAPRVGSDPPRPPAAPVRSDFNPRSPCGERPSPSLLILTSPVSISIHAPRAGSDL